MPASRILYLSLINAQTKQELARLTNGSVLNVSDYGFNINVVAITSPSTVSSVSFSLTGTKKQSRRDYNIPYTLFTDAGWKPTIGSYTLTVTPKYGSTTGTKMTVGFSFTSVAPPPPPPPATGTTFYASPSGGGNGTLASPFRVSDFWPLAGPGKQLRLLPGRYTGAASMILPPNGLAGTSTAPISIVADVDGTVEIDGQRIDKPCELLSGNHWFIIEGINMHHSGGYGSGNHVCNVRDSNDVTFRRCLGWEAQSGDTNIFRTQHSERTLFEDCGGWGTARKVFSNSQGGNSATYRRCFARWEGSTQEGPKKAFGMSYNSYGLTVENCVATWDGLKMSQNYELQNQGAPLGQFFSNYTVQQPDGVFATDGDDANLVANVKMLGCISFVRNGQRYHNSTKKWAGGIATFVKGVRIENCATFFGTDHADIWSTNLEDAGLAGSIVKDCTFIGGDPGRRPNTGAGWLSTGHFAANSLPAGRNITRASDSTGANITNRYVNGVLTNTALWPWPMNQRIIDAMIMGGYQPFDVTSEVFSLGGVSTDTNTLATLGRQWLSATGATRTALEPQLIAQTTSIDQVIAKVRPNSYPIKPKGEVLYQDIPGYPNHQYHMVVPQTYDPSRPVGVIIWLHGGGTWEASEIGHIYAWDLDPGPPITTTGRSFLRPHTDASNYIVIAPIAPFWNQNGFDLKVHGSRWDVPGVDRYLQDILTEVEKSYNLDRNRVAVVGFSMGGKGTSHMTLRANDLLAATVPFSFSWKIGAWSKLNGLAVYPISGDADATIPVGFARVANQCLNAGTSPHTYIEFAGGHEYGAPAVDFIKDFVKQGGILEGLSRDPYRKVVHARNKWRSYVTAENFQYTWDERESPHTYWVTINETKTGNITYDQAVQNGTTITKGAVSVSGASVDASITGSTIVVTTQNVKSFSLWLHPSMVGGASSVTIIVDGVPRAVQMTPTLLDALRSYERRWDWNMIYHDEVVITLP